jgi:type IV pilus assembly protein PilA
VDAGEIEKAMKNLKRSLRQTEANCSARRRADAGFTLIELLIVMSVMLILMTLAIPQVLKIHKQADETSAVQSMRTIGNAQSQYMNSYPSNGYSCNLAALGGVPGSGPPTPQAAQMLDPVLASGAKSGYLFNVTNCTKVTINNTDMYTGYQVTAVPATVGRTGDRGYCMDENNLIKFDPNGGTNCTQTLGQ